MAAAYAVDVDGNEPEYGAVLGAACYELAQRECQRLDIEELSRQTIASNIGPSAVSCARSLQSLGRNEDLSDFVNAAIENLKKIDGNKESCAGLLLQKLMAHLNKMNYDEAEAVYNELTNSYGNHLNMSDQIALQNAERILKAGKTNFAELPTDKSDAYKIAEMRKQLASTIFGGLQDMFPGDMDLSNALLERKDADKAKPTDPAEFMENALKMQEIMEQLRAGKKINVQAEIAKFQGRTRKQSNDK